MQKSKPPAPPLRVGESSKNCVTGVVEVSRGPYDTTRFPIRPTAGGGAPEGVSVSYRRGVSLRTLTH